MGEPGTGDVPGSGLAHDRIRGSRAAVTLFVLAVAVNLLVVFWPLPPSDAPGLFPHADKIAHVLVFAAVGWTGVRARIPLLPLVLLLAAHAVESELVQHFLLPGRSGDAADTVADLAGVAAGTVLPRAGAAARLGH